MFKKLSIFGIVFLFCINIAFCSDFSVHKLPNGQTLIIKEMHNNKIVTIDTWVKTGSINENDSNNGISHFLEHLFFKGTKRYPVGVADSMLESKGAIVNAATSKDFTHYYVTIPSDNFDLALEIHSDMLSNPQIPRKELEKERKVVIEEICKDANSPSKRLYDNLNDLMYTNHPYKRKVIGEAYVVSTVTREEILNYFNDYYSPSNMITIVVGDINTDDVIKKVSEHFENNCKKVVRRNNKREGALDSQKRHIEYMDTNTGYMMIGYRGAEITNADTYALDVLSQVLGGGKSSILYKNVKEQKNLAFSISASNGSYKEDGIFYITANFNSKNTDKLEKAIFDEINRIQKYGITEEDLNIAKNMIEQDTYYSRESTSNIATELGYVYTLTGGADFYTNYIDNIKKVSLKDIQNIAHKYLSQNRCAISVVLPQDLKEQVVEEKAPSKSKFISENANVKKYETDKGMVVLTSPHTGNDIIALSIISKGGGFLENIPGEGTLLAETILKGTKKYSAQELTNLMEENGIKISPSCLDDYFIINVQATTSQVDLMFDILDEIINNPVLDEADIEKKRFEIANKIKQQRDIPMNKAVENFKTLIFEGSVYSNSNKVIEKNLPKIRRDDVVSFYNKIFLPQDVVISVNGNIEDKVLTEKLGKIFNKENKSKFDYKNYNITHLKKTKNSIVKINDLKTSWLILGWQTEGINNKQDFVTLKLINTIIGSGMSSRLFRSLREEYGLAYQLGSNYSPKMNAGSFITFIGTKPETLDSSKNKIFEEINNLKMKFVSDAELDDAKSRLKGGFVIALETNSDKAATVGMFEAYGLGYNFMDEYVKLIDNTTASDILRVANKYFNGIYVLSEVTCP